MFLQANLMQRQQSMIIERSLSQPDRLLRRQKRRYRSCFVPYRSAVNDTFQIFA